jgi:hypothetical protein
VSCKQTGTFKLNLLNHTKSNSLFNYGMRVLVGRESPQDGSYSWAREGYNISYKQNGYKRTARDTNHYTLTFEVDCV